MRLLHVSDWHIGRTNDEVSRAEDHDEVFAEIVRIASRERPDVIIHSGDLFDHVRPSYVDIGRAVAVLRELAEIAPVVVICGNHDSPLLFRLLAEMLGHGSRIRFVDRPLDASAGGVLHFAGSEGDALRLAVLPFVHMNRVVNAFDDAAHWRKAYAERIARMQHLLSEELFRDLDPRHDVTAFAGHQYLSGATLAGSERRVHACDRYATNSEDVPQVGYAAFGDIHKPQAIPGSGVTGRYAGSPIQLDFGEEGERKSVVVVDLHPGEEAAVRTVELTGGRRLRRIEGSIERIRELAAGVGRELCRVIVDTPTHVPALSEDVRALLPHATLLDVKQRCADQKLLVPKRDESPPGAEPGLEELFEEYLTSVGTTSATAEVVKSLFTTMVEAAESGVDPTLEVEAVLTAPLPSLHQIDEVAS